PHGDATSGQSLCMSCGLCCDGTLLGSVRLAPEEDAAALEESGITTVMDKGQHSFKLPCACYTHSLCTIYASRPLACRKFQCGLSQQYERHELSYAEALHTVQTTI